MSSWLYILSLILLISIELCVGKEHCEFDDEVCMTKSANYFLKRIVPGNQSLGIDSSDPLYVDKINVNLLHDMYYTFNNAYMYGINNCIVKRLILVMESLWYYDLICPRLIFKADYIEKGLVSSVPIESEGKAVIIFDNYHVGTQGDYEIVTSSDGILHINITSCIIYHLESKDNVTYNFTNLFSNDKERSEMAHQLFNDNRNEVKDDIKYPLMQPMISQLINNINKFLATKPKYGIFYNIP